MQINKFIIRVSHVFGLMKKKEAQDDITVNISHYDYGINTDWWEFAMNKKFNDPRLKYIQDDVRKCILQCFEANPRKKKACENIKAVWVTYHPKGENSGSIINSFRYENGEILFG